MDGPQAILLGFLSALMMVMPSLCMALAGILIGLVIRLAILMQG